LRKIGTNFYLDPKRLSCLKAILAMLNPAQDSAANKGKRTISSRMSMTYFLL